MIAYLAIGVPGCGKTTAFKQLADKQVSGYVNRDDIREELTGDMRNHSKEQEVTRVMFERIAEALVESDVYIDMTHYKRQDRMRMIAFCREHGAQAVIGCYFDIPIPVCKERNAQRQQPVPTAAINRMAAALKKEPPVAEEGFDQIVVISN